MSPKTATGITYIYQSSWQVNITTATAVANKFGIPHHSISVSLNVLLTLMIATRLILHDREVKSALGASVSANGLYKAVVAVLTESCALYAVTFLLFVGPWAAGSPVASTFFPILVQTQVRDTFRYIVDLWHFCPTTLTNRSSLHSSSSCELRTGARHQTKPLSLGTLVRFILGLEGSLRVARGYFMMMGIMSLARWIRIEKLLAGSRVELGLR